MKHPPQTQVFGPVINRVSDVMIHLNRYTFHGVTNLANDARLSKASVSRLINGKMNPSFALVARITRALEAQLGFRIDPRDVVAENGEFLTRYACDLVSCRGCHPGRARDDFGNFTPAFAGVPKGKWVSSKYPKGFNNNVKEDHE